MDTPRIKYFLLNKFPKPIFDVIFKIWKVLGKPILTFLSKQRLKNFNGESIKTIQTHGEEFQIFINSKNGYVDETVFLNGVYEPFFLFLIKKHLKKGSVFIDIGANIGQHSLFASRVVGNTGKVISFEPVKRLYNQFKKSIEINNLSNIEAFNFGCGDKEEELEIYLNQENMGASSIIGDNKKNGSESIKIIVPDDILFNEDKIDFIKIDVEGYEYHVLLGLDKTLNKHHPTLLVEYTPAYYDKIDVTHKRKIIDLLLSKGYEIFDVENKQYIKNFDMIKLNGKNNLKNYNLMCTNPM